MVLIWQRIEHDTMMGVALLVSAVLHVCLVVCCQDWVWQVMECDMKGVATVVSAVLYTCGVGVSGTGIRKWRMWPDLSCIHVWCVVYFGEWVEQEKHYEDCGCCQDQLEQRIEYERSGLSNVRPWCQLGDMMWRFCLEGCQKPSFMVCFQDGVK